MELKRRWQSFYRRFAQLRPAGVSGSTAGLNLRGEIDNIVQNAEKELVIVDMAGEPLFFDEDFIEELTCRILSATTLKVQLFLYVKDNDLSKEDDSNPAYQFAEAVRIRLKDRMYTHEKKTIRITVLHEQPYILFYLNENELLIKDVFEGEFSPVSIKFSGVSVFEKDCRRYIDYILKTPEIFTELLQLPDALLDSP